MTQTLFDTTYFLCTVAFPDSVVLLMVMPPRLQLRTVRERELQIKRRIFLLLGLAIQRKLQGECTYKWECCKFTRINSIIFSSGYFDLHVLCGAVKLSNQYVSARVISNRFCENFALCVSCWFSTPKERLYMLAGHATECTFRFLKQEIAASSSYVAQRIHWSWHGCGCEKGMSPGNPSYNFGTHVLGETLVASGAQWWAWFSICWLVCSSVWGCRLVVEVLIRDSATGRATAWTQNRFVFLLLFFRMLPSPV